MWREGFLVGLAGGGEVWEEGLEEVNGIGRPGPGAEGSDGAGAEEAVRSDPAIDECLDFGEIDSDGVEGGEEFGPGSAAGEDDIVASGEVEREGIEIVQQCGLEAGRGEVVAAGDGFLGERIEEVDGWGAPAGPTVDGEFADEAFVEAGRAAGQGIGLGTFGAGGREGELQLALIGIPIVEGRVLPTTEPFQAIGDVTDFVAMDVVEEGGGDGIAGFVEGFGVDSGEIEVGLFEGEREAGDVIEGGLHAGEETPEMA
jgi:hypothetical protein